jgi:hypothetical protein
MEKILRGLMNYRLTHQRNMVAQFKKVSCYWKHGGTVQKGELLLETL